jgi:hypothetical protein
MDVAVDGAADDPATGYLAMFVPRVDIVLLRFELRPTVDLV